MTKLKTYCTLLAFLAYIVSNTAQPSNLGANPHSPWHQTWWIYFAATITICLIVFLFLKHQTNRRIKQAKSEHHIELEALKKKLHTNVSHEFRTPLTVILGMNENIQGHEKERGLIRRNAQTLLRFVNQMLEINQLDDGTLATHLSKKDVIALLHESTEQFYSAAKDKKISLNFQSSIRELYMDLDEEKIKQIMHNLLSNAIKFTKPSGHVWVTVGCKTIDYSEFLHIKIKDTGTGISQEFSPHLFERFSQYDDKRKKANIPSGVGIGLALTKELVDLMNGKISMSNESPTGTTFIVFLPIHI